MAYPKCLALALFLVHATNGIFFNVFDGSTSNPYSTFEPSSALQRFLTRCQNTLNTAPDTEDVCDFLNHDLSMSLLTMGSECIVSAWYHNDASNWTSQQVGDWLRGFVDHGVVESLLHSSLLTGHVLPSIFLPEVEQNFSSEHVKLLQRHVAELILFGPPPVLSISSLSATAIALVATLLLAASLVIRVYAVSRIQRFNHMCRLQFLTDYFNDIHMRSVAFTPLSPPGFSAACPSPAGRSDDRRSSSVSQANGSAVSVMQRLVCSSLRAEYESILGSVDEAKHKLDALGTMVHDRRSWVPFSQNSVPLDSAMEQLSTFLNRLVERLQELIQRQYCMHEAMDILWTLNDCQSKAELSYREECVCFESGERQTASVLEPNLSHRQSVQTELPSATSHATCEHASLSPASGTNSPQLEAAAAASSLSDENSPSGLQNFTDEDADSEPAVPVLTKIPKLRGLHDFALSPSFYLMNPPSTRLRPPAHISTPSHIPVGPLKTPLNSSLRKLANHRPNAALVSPNSSKLVNT